MKALAAALLFLFTFPLQAAGPPRTLEEALLNHTWEWTHAPNPPDMLTFQADGLAVCDRFAFRWKVTAPRTVVVYEAIMDGKKLHDFKATLTFDPEFNHLEGRTGNGRQYYTGRRLEVTDEEAQAFRKALVSSKWIWVVLQPNRDPWDERQFAPDGTATAWRRGTMMCTGRWEITGPRTVRIQNITQKNVHILTFDPGFSSFVGVDGSGENHYQGTRKPGGPERASVAATAPLMTVETLPGQPRLEVLKEQGPNAMEWALAALDQDIPSNLRQNFIYLREDLLDEGKSGPKAGAAAYELGTEYCDRILAALEQRDLARVNAGYRAAQADADRRASNQQLDARRNYQMSWPQYHREESQRAALRDQQNSAAEVKKERINVEWADRTVKMRAYLDGLYSRYREALRE